MFDVSRLLPAGIPLFPQATATATATAGPGGTATATATAGPGGTATATATANGPGASAFANAGGVPFANPLPAGPRCFCPEPPVLCHPRDALKESQDGKIHTPGGYTIETSGNTNWKITGPDGKSTCVEGDPHVKESDGGKWDFKRNSSFVLPDGTSVNVKTAPAGNGMTVTSALEVVNGNNRVEIDGVNSHCPHTSTVQHCGPQWNTAGWDHFTMGHQTDDWAFGGREIVGSEKGGEVLKVGDPLSSGHRPGIHGMFDDVRRMLDRVPEFRPPLPFWNLFG
jgi:uncharacterized protein DUF1521